MAPISAVLRAAARAGRIEFEQQGFDQDGLLLCVVGVTTGEEEWMPIALQLHEDERGELLAFFEDIARNDDLGFLTIVPCGWPGFPLQFVGSNPGDGGDVSLRITGEWSQPFRNLKETELFVPVTRLKAFWPTLARVMEWPGYRDGDRRLSD